MIDLIVEEPVRRGFVSPAFFEEYMNINDKTLTSDVMAGEDIINESKKENVNLIQTDHEDADIEPQSLVALNEVGVALKTMQQFLMQQDNA